MNRFTKLWREATSIIPLVQRTSTLNFKKYICDYDVLVQERSKKQSFMPSSIVFPGGMIEPGDTSLDWIEHMKSFSIQQEHFDVFNHSQRWDTPIFQGNHSNENRHISLRICAIRETFEELGILLCKRNDEQPNVNPWIHPITDFDIKYWQEKVHTNPHEFLNLCKELKCYPDIWSLYYWCEWLTPVGLYPVRYDTAFFLIFLKSQPTIIKEQTEVTDALLLSPEQLIDNYSKKKLYLPPPQAYELLRLRNQKSIEEIIRFAADRNPNQPELMYPIIANAMDGHFYIFPGDELYPKSPDLNDCKNYFSEQLLQRFNSQTLEQLRDEMNSIHRIEINDKQRLCINNYIPRGNHLMPASSTIV